jgi:hypothetical protein
MADRRSVRPSFEDGVKNQKVLDAWERSAKKRRWEKVYPPGIVSVLP